MNKSTLDWQGSIFVDEKISAEIGDILFFIHIINKNNPEFYYIGEVYFKKYDKMIFYDTSKKLDYLKDFLEKQFLDLIKESLSFIDIDFLVDKKPSKNIKLNN